MVTLGLLAVTARLTKTAAVVVKVSAMFAFAVAWNAVTVSLPTFVSIKSLGRQAMPVHESAVVCVSSKLGACALDVRTDGVVVKFSVKPATCRDVAVTPSVVV